MVSGGGGAAAGGGDRVRDTAVPADKIGAAGIESHERGWTEVIQNFREYAER